MAFSKITIKFTSMPSVDSNLSFSENAIALLLCTETFKISRSSNYQVKIPTYSLNTYHVIIPNSYDKSNLGVSYFDTTWRNQHINSVLAFNNLDGTTTYEVYATQKPTFIAWNTYNGITIGYDWFINIYSENIATNYRNAFNLDYNTTNLFTVNLLPTTHPYGIVEIIANYNNAVFTETVNTSGAIVTIENQTPISLINVTSATFSAGTNATDIKVNITTNIQASKMTLPINIDPVTTNPFSYIFARGEDRYVKVETAGAVSPLFFVRTPSELKLANTNINIINTPTGATVTVVVTSVAGLTLQYSLDGYTWQSSNLFSGITDGSYQIYIKEQFGFQIQKAFTVASGVVGGNLAVTPNFIIPIPNSIRYADRYANKKNINTTLSSEELVRLPYCHKQMFLDTDIITTQVKTSYKNLSAYVTDGNTNIPLTISKKTNYIGTKDMRDGNVRRRPDGRLGVSFISGNIYDYDSPTIVTGTYNSGGNIPAWATIESYFNVASLGYMAISDIIRDETNSFWELVTEYDYTGIPFSAKISTIYNAQNYEIYEFNLAMANYVNTPIQVVIHATNPNWDDVAAISEIIYVQKSFENTVEIEYWNDTNTAHMFYQTGIKNKMIHDAIITNYKSDGKQDVHLGDTRAILVDSTLSNTFELIIFEVTTAIVRQIAFAMSHKFIKINDLFYVAKEKVSAEKIGEHTNLYNVSVTIIEAGNFYSEEITIDRAYGDLTGLLTAEYDYIKI